MKVHLYALCKNEARMLPFFFRHYDSWVDRYIIYDDDSTDASVEICRENSKVEVRKFLHADPDSFIISQKLLSDSCWKESKGVADWVIIVDIDEHLVHSDMKAYLERCRRSNVTIIPAIGYQMLSRVFPDENHHLCATNTIGAFWDKMCKPSIFNPNTIDEINFIYGRHIAYPVGDARLPDNDELQLLHYKYLSLDYIMQRFAVLKTGTGRRDVENKWRGKYCWTRQKVEAHWAEFEKRAIDLRENRGIGNVERQKLWWRNRADSHSVFTESPSS